MTLATISTGLHLVRKRRKAGDRWYVYAYRGGPCIHSQDGAKPAITPDLLEKAYEERRHKGAPDAFDNVINLYRESPDFARLSDSTRREYRLRLDQISHRFGQVPIRFFNGDKIRGEVIQWRDEMSDTPRAADRSVGMLATLLKWARDRTSIRENPAADIAHLHKANRADLIWEDRHWQAVEKVPPQVHRVLKLASLTGLRQSDLLNLTWDQVTPDYIATVTQKTGGEAVIPMHDELARYLMGPGKGAVLRNSKGEPWTSSGFQSSWGKSKPEGFDRRFHDLRGTFATRLMIAGFTDTDIALTMGWTAERIAVIRARYVDRVRVAKERAKQLRKP